MNCYASELIAGIKNEDEFTAFRMTLKKVKESNSELLNEIAASLSELKKKFLEEVVFSQRVVLNQAGTTEARKVVRPIGKKVAKQNKVST